MYELHHAAKYGNLTSLRELLSSPAYAANVNAFDQHGRTPLMYAVRSAGVEGVDLLLAAGASANQEGEKAEYGSVYSVLSLAVGAGDPAVVAAVLKAGADIGYSLNGYDVLIDAVHGRDVLNDSRLLSLLELLVSAGARLNTVTSHNESVVRVLSRIGRFDAVGYLLSIFADESLLSWTPLIRSVAIGTIADMQREIDLGASIEDRDYWRRTAWLVAIQTGDVKKADWLLKKGANRNVVGRCAKPSLFYAIENYHGPMLRWLLQMGEDVEQADEFEKSALMCASQCNNKEAVDMLLLHGAKIERQRSHNQSALSDCQYPEIALTLLTAGADPKEISRECRRLLLRLSGEPNVDLLDVTPEQFGHGQNRRFGSSNPEAITEPFWEGMIRSGVNGYLAAQKYEDKKHVIEHPVWCADRFGQSLTFLPDGRIVQIGGEHEDHYDPDFCIFNDVFVHEPNGAIHIFGYPEADFPPTDFHTATLIGQEIYIIGSLGYNGSRRFSETPVYALDITSFKITKIDTAGLAPGWIYGHRAVLQSPEEIRISGGTLVNQETGEEKHVDNDTVFILNIRTREWRKGDI